MTRIDSRSPDELRPLSFELDYVKHPEGSVLVRAGETVVLCTVSVEDGVPRWMPQQGKSGGWITGEYSMLPGSTHTRNSRETRGPRGRTQEIQRLIGRSLRAAVDLEALGERTLVVDCDVLQADGGTRTASITGASVAVHLVLARMVARHEIPPEAHHAMIGAVSVGMCNGQPFLDLCYEEDVAADVDFNVVMTDSGKFIELQGTAEGKAFSKDEFDRMIALAEKGIQEIFERQRDVLAESGYWIGDW